jgi:tetratricopeptide (TPR) repeat protein
MNLLVDGIAQVLLLLVLSAGSQAQVHALSPGADEPRLTEARSLLNQGAASEAEQVVRAFLKEHPGSAEAHFLLGYVLFREIQTDAERNADALRDDYQRSGHLQTKNQFHDAAARASLAEFTEGAKYHPPSAFDLKIVALDYVLLGDFADADKWLTRSLQLEPGDSQAWYYLGRAKYNENRFAEAIAAFEECLKRSAKSVQVVENLGLAYAGLGRPEEAIAAYKTAMALQENFPKKDPGPYIDMGDLLLDQNRAEDAVTYLRQAVEIAPRNSKAHELLGKGYARLNRLPLAQGELETAIRIAPQIGSLHCMLGPIYRKQGLMKEAKAEFESCSSLSGANPPPEKIQR